MLNNETMTPVEPMRKQHKIVARLGIGDHIHVADITSGTKGGVAFKDALASILVKAHHLLEKHMLTKH